MKHTLLLPIFLFSFFTTKAQTTSPAQADTATKADSNKRFMPVEVMPMYPGGLDKMSMYFKRNLKYPKAARKADLEGRVIVSFVVEKDGSLTDIKVQRGISPEIDAEALRLVTNFPKWTPGMQGGRPVRVRYSIPVSFKLND